MVTTDDRYFTCPYCGLVLLFNFIEQENIYRAKCAYCSNVLEMNKEEFETTDIGIYFEKDF